MPSVPQAAFVVERSHPQAWRLVFKHQIAPLFSVNALETLRAALRSHSSRVLQHLPIATHLRSRNVQVDPCPACPIGTMLIADGARTVGEVEDRFANVCRHIGEPIDAFLTWLNRNPRKVVVSSLLAEVEAILGY